MHRPLPTLTHRRAALAVGLPLCTCGEPMPTRRLRHLVIRDNPSAADSDFYLEARMRPRLLMLLIPVALACTPSDQGRVRSIVAPGAALSFNDTSRIDRDGKVDLIVDPK